MSKELTFYHDLLADIKVRVRAAQHKAALSANAEMILLYWDIGRMIAARQEREGWGAGVIPRLAADLKNELPEEKGFSARNIGRMIAFYRAYSILPQAVANSEAESVPLLESGGGEPTAILPQPVAKLGSLFFLPMVQRSVALLPWGHNILLLQKVKDLPTRLWYARQSLEQGWSRDTLTLQIKNRAHERQGTAVTNFSTTLPDVHASLAQGLLKDPYLFDFLTLEEPFHERELETGLLAHVQKFLLELGRGFAFVGRQYRLEVSDREFYLDLLFYHLHLRCYVVVTPYGLFRGHRGYIKPLRWLASSARAAATSSHSCSTPYRTDYSKNHPYQTTYNSYINCKPPKNCTDRSRNQSDRKSD